jgi:acetate kinase
MKILTVNAGSSSIRLEVFTEDRDGHLSSLCRQHYEIDRTADAGSLLDHFINKQALHDIAITGHRVVHGGSAFTEPCLIDSSVEQEINKLAPLAPLHNPVSLAWIKAAKKILGESVPRIAVFDTSFFQDMPDVASTYALPVDLCRGHQIRRFGFHGIAHRAMWQHWAESREDLASGGRVITLQLGAGCSMTAVKRGQVQDTSMGFSPLEGLMMATRCGDLDPGVITYLLGQGDYTPAQLDSMLNHESGLVGVSGFSADMRELLQSPRPQARFAIELFCYRVRKYIGAYIAVLGGLDGIVFGGGIGEHAPEIRQLILKEMGVFGIELDLERNSSSVKGDQRISAESSAVEVRVTAVDEASILAQEAVRLFTKPQTDLIQSA